MNEQQQKYARLRAYEAGGIATDADQASAEKAYNDAFNEARKVGLADEREALKSALIAQGVAAEKVTPALESYDALEKRANERRHGLMERLRKPVIAALVVIAAIILASWLYFRVASSDNSSPPATEPPGTISVIVDRPSDANSTPATR